MSTGGFLGGGGATGGSGADGIPIIGPVFNFLTEIFSQANQIAQLARSTEQVEQQAWGNTLNLAGWAYGALGGILGTLGDLLKHLADLLGNLFGSVIWGFIKGLFRKILDWITKLRNWIRVHIAAWQKIQRQLDQTRSMYMRKLLDIFQRIRKILVPFRLLHLGFASKLDATLARYESDLGAKWAKLIAFDRQVLGVLNDVLTPSALLRPGHALGSIGMMIGAVHEAVGAADVRTLFCMSPLVAPQPLVNPWSTTAALTVSDVQHHSGDYAVYEAQRDQTLRQYAIDLGTVSPV